MASWISVAKPTSSVITRVNPQGKEQYDQVTIEYDQSTVFYDGINTSLWSALAKPTSSTWTKISKPT